VTKSRYEWAKTGDINAFFGLMLDNIAGLVLLVSLLAEFGFPVTFALSYMVPGTAIGVLVGDLLFFALAFWYAKKTGKTEVTAMPLGLDTPSTFGMALFILGPAYVAATTTGGMSPDEAAMHTWHIGMCAIFITGAIKAVLSFFSGWVHRMVPRAGLLGSLAAIALVLIAFSPLAEMATMPAVGFASLALVLVTLIGRQRLPAGIPGALAAVVIGTGIYYLLYGVGYVTDVELVEKASQEFKPAFMPQGWLEAFKFEWIDKFGATLPYLGFIVPFAVVTVVGGIDCAESAASVGDEYHTGTVIGVEAFATLLASICGGVIQTTPYIGHPAYKAMGGRAAYTLATALFVGGAGLLGYFGFLFLFIPKAAIFPILIFIGIEITAQSFHVTPKRHYAAIAVACLPAIAKLVVLNITPYVVALGFTFEDPKLATSWLYANVLAGGFIFTSVIWASATAKMIDRRYFSAGLYLALGGVFTLFGIMHSPLAGDQMFLPTSLMDEKLFDAAKLAAVRDFAITYFVMAGIMFGLGALLKDEPVIDTDEQYDALGH
jgi:AGZA family xanthine/uracil permease-like MFS transporter